MTLWIIILLAIGLGMDVLSVCAAIGVRWHGPRQMLRLSVAMGFFQFAMPLAGYFVGLQLAGPLAQWGRYVAAALLAGLGVKMLVEAIRNRPASTADEIDAVVEHALHMHPEDPTHGQSLIILSIATSLDALLAGFSLAIYDTSIWRVSVIIGIASALMAVVGVLLGRFVGKMIGRPAEFLGAAVLIGLAIKFLFVAC
jgi:manganese efflux pump family protein